jgi:hypothetical protein
MGAIFSAYWLIYVRDFPSQTKHIRSEEIQHIEDSAHKIGQKQQINTPW